MYISFAILLPSSVTECLCTTRCEPTCLWCVNCVLFVVCALTATVSGAQDACMFSNFACTFVIYLAEHRISNGPTTSTSAAAAPRRPEESCPTKTGKPYLYHYT